MTEIGKFNTLKIVRSSDFGLMLDDGDGGEILLPNREVPDTWTEGRAAGGVYIPRFGRPYHGDPPEAAGDGGVNLRCCR